MESCGRSEKEGEAVSDYIEREAAINAVFEAFADGRSAYIALEAIPAADVVARDCYDRLLAENDELRKMRPVVLCRDCKWCHAGYCEKYDDIIPFGCANKPWEDWFCADGEKREES